MGTAVLILGRTGSGKSYAIKTMDPLKVGIFEIEKQHLPFKAKDFKVAKNATYNTIAVAFKEPQFKSYVIDDSQYLLVNEMFDKAKDSDMANLQTLRFTSEILFIISMLVFRRM